MSDLKDLAAEITKKLRDNFPDNDLAIQQVLCLCEEAGEFTGAYRRWAGMARRPGPWEDVQAELADVIITAYVTAEVLGITAESLEGFRDSLGKPVPSEAMWQVRAVFRAVAQFVAAFDRLIPSTTLLVMRLAMVINVAYATAQVLGIDLDAAWRDKPAEVSR